MTGRAATDGWPWWRRALVGATVAVAMLLGLGMVVVAVTVGRCDAFGGRCPADPPPLFEDDVFGIAAFGAALLVAVPIFVMRPSMRRLLIAVGVGVASALFVGLIARSSAYG
jgi:hypothetical protein